MKTRNPIVMAVAAFSLLALLGVVALLASLGFIDLASGQELGESKPGAQLEGQAVEVDTIRICTHLSCASAQHGS